MINIYFAFLKILQSLNIFVTLAAFHLFQIVMHLLVVLKHLFVSS